MFENYFNAKENLASGTGVSRIRLSGALVLLLVCAACAGEAVSPEPVREMPSAKMPAAMPSTEMSPARPPAAGNFSHDAPQDISSELERIAEIERSGAFFPGLGFAESAIREGAGDFAGAAVAAFKELSWAYAYGAVGGDDVLEGLGNVLIFLGDLSVEIDPVRGAGAAAVKGCLAFFREDWEQAEELLGGVLTDNEEPDSFLRWMLLVCSIERENKDAGNAGSSNRTLNRSAYGAIRARYALFPEYWYRGARLYAAGDGAGDEDLAAAYAEQGINTSPQGPFAVNSRKILAGLLGLGAFDSGLLTKAEIENIIRVSVSENDPAILEELFPLMALPENPYTIYALGALRVLASLPAYRSFFNTQAFRVHGRLGERLNYISRG